MLTQVITQDLEEDSQQHMNSIVDNATYDIEEDPAFEDFKMAAANAAAKGEKEFEYPRTR